MQPSSHIRSRRTNGIVFLVPAAIFTLVLNAGTLLSVATHRGTGIADMGTSVDEAYYFSLIRDAATGHMNLGNASLKEHADDPAVSSYGPLVQGVLMKFSGLSIGPIVLAGDLLFAMLMAFLLCLVFVPLTGDDRLAALLGLATAAGAVGSGMLRSVSPQTTLPVVAAYLAVFVRGGNQRQMVLRGICIGLLVYLQPVYALWLLMVEACDLVATLHVSGWRWRERVMPIIFLGMPLVAAAAGKLLLLSKPVDAVAVADTYHRLGMIPSRYPANPVLQCLLLVALAALVLVRWKKKSDGRYAVMLMTLLIAGLLALYQSVLHGIDIIFGLYYALPLRVVLWIVWLTVVMTLIPGRRVRYAVAGIACVFVVFGLAKDTQARFTGQQTERQAFAVSGVQPVLDWLRSQQPEQVVLAPYEVADLVPVFTDDYVAFSRHARYQLATDRELAERYLLQEAFFPTLPDQEDKTYNLVFGLYAGNVDARQRTVCRIRVAFGLSSDACVVDIRGKIVHQDVLAMLDEKNADAMALLKRFDVAYVVAPDSSVLPSGFAGYCVPAAMLAPYRVYRCGSGNSRF